MGGVALSSLDEEGTATLIKRLCATMKLEALEAPLLAQGFDGDDLADESLFDAAQLDIIIPPLAGEEEVYVSRQKHRFFKKIVKLRSGGVPPQLCAPPPLAPLPGEIDTTRLEIDRADLIGSGGFGTVYGAVLDGAPVAVKLVKPEQSPYGPLAMRKKLVEEVEIMKKACDSSSSGVCELFGTVALRTGELGLVMKVRIALGVHTLSLSVFSLSVSLPLSLSLSLSHRVNPHLSSFSFFTPPVALHALAAG